MAFTRLATFVARLPELRGGSHNFGFSIGLPPACGETWHEPVATDLACLPSPCTIKRIPKTGDLLVIWNQVSRWESMQGLIRHRLSCAVSSDEGESWHHHRNLESFDDMTHVKLVGVSTVLHFCQ